MVYWLLDKHYSRGRSVHAVYWLFIKHPVYTAFNVPLLAELMISVVVINAVKVSEEVTSSIWVYTLHTIYIKAKEIIGGIVMF